MRIASVLALASAIAASAGIAAAETVCLEAEAAGALEAPVAIAVIPTNSPLPATIHKDASGGMYIEISQGKGNPPAVTNGEASYSFAVSNSAEYVLWCRVWWEDECGNSLSILLDDGKPFVFGEDSTFKCWHWIQAPKRLKQLILNPGRHSMRIRNREDGVAIDQILFTDDRKYVPVGVENAAKAPPAATNAPPAADRKEQGTK
ncbi:MAG: hypothetical protein C0404_08035 [Verrucomicrobia bacterium]|nr:hypothetical protein [Verrucomicrobiota bacterium]